MKEETELFTRSESFLRFSKVVQKDSTTGITTTHYAISSGAGDADQPTSHLLLTPPPALALVRVRYFYSFIFFLPFTNSLSCTASRSPRCMVTTNHTSSGRLSRTASAAGAKHSTQRIGNRRLLGKTQELLPNQRGLAAGDCTTQRFEQLC